MLMEALLGWLATKVLDRALDALAERPGIQQVRRLLTGDPARAALLRAMRQAYAELEERYPRLASDAFHETFFRQEEVVAELARVLSRRPGEAPEPERLAELARAQYRPGYEPPWEELLPAAGLFLRRFREAAEEEIELQPLFDSRALERLHEIAALVRTAYPRVPYREEVGALMDFYTERFVGREEAIEAVTAFTAQEEGGYLLIEAGPGMGKTALVAQLVHRYERGTWRPGGVADHPPLLYAFLRQERGWHTPAPFLAALDSQLLDALGIPGGIPTDVEALGRLFAALWNEAAARARPDRPLTLLVDGLDEMIPDERNRTVAHFLPDRLPPHVHVVVTSRPQPKAFDWVPAYHPLKKARVHRLARFGPQEVRALLAQAGDAVPRDEAFVQRLVDLTRGEPLFLRFLCQDVADWGREAEARLDALPPLEGVEDYFREQLRLLGERAEGEDIRHILGMLVVARGGMTADELADALGMPKMRALDALEPIRRFLLGEERMELMHLEFRRLVEREWFTQRERRDYRERLLSYCARWREHESDYALEHYAAHLFEAGRYGELHGLIDKEWMELKRRRTGSHRSFAADVDLAFRAAEEGGIKGLPRLVQCALLSATLGSLATQVPPEVLGVMARLGQARRALDYARLMVDLKRKAEALRLIGLALWEQGQADEAAAALDEA
ncbi:MAG TPA: ATP-binding protein, partial [Anaerolineae bacterium]|nr:ATP-binding protein [Anaerolineae bacterium]